MKRTAGLAFLLRLAFLGPTALANFLAMMSSYVELAFIPPLPISYAHRQPSTI
jgi:hypothetical protein